MADGHHVRPLGTIKLPLLIDNQYIYQIFVVADIDIPVVLGYDFMYNKQCVIDVPNKNLLLNSQTVDCHLESQIPSLFKISIDKQVTIPPNSETIIHALPNEKLPYGTTMILDNTSQSFKNKGVLVAKSICTFKGDNLPLRVMNMTDLPQTLYKNTCAGTAETVCSENILGNINAEPDLVLPEHMQVVIEKCKSNLKVDQCKIVVDLLTKYSGAFAMSKNDLGRTDIIQHKINSGDAHPIKQNPRRVPLAQRKEVDEEIQRMLEGEFILDTDASGTGVGAVLSQINAEGKECVIAYFSRTLSKTERQYCVTRRELLAIVLAVKHFHHYFYGVKFTVRTDDGALNWLKNFKNPEGQLARWLEILGTYTFIIKHRAGLKHGNADGLSRRPRVNCKHCDTRDVTEVSYQIENPTIRSINMLDENETEDTPIITNWFNNKTPEEFKQAQLDDPIISRILTWKKSSDKPKWPEISHLSQHHKTYWSQWDRLTVVDGILYRKWENTTTNDINLQYVLPSADRNRVLLLLHNDQLGGHLGFKRTIARIRHRFYWAGYTSFVERWCPVTRTYKGNKYVIVVTDYFTRYAEAYGVTDIGAQTVADKLLEEFICRYGLPLQIHTDQGSQFTSDLFIQLSNKLHIDKTRNSPFHPQSSGLVERLNRTIEDMISKFVSKHQKDWDQYLPYLMMAYRSSVHETLGETYGKPQLLYITDLQNVMLKLKM
ncbi:unnamed protein product [Mytilus coruscus]|uniref:Integrase catalytic domain-containing protein n=1 Tax=Mytilus coruscus TaxID=42192 RepID=A0A6J8CQL6_MYTCO|nr:unnamed protein product [Mytilus coruscus]